VTRRVLTGAIVLVAVVAVVSPAWAYLHLSLTLGRGQVRNVTWARSPVRWFSANTAAPGVSSAQFQQSVSAAFATWEAVPTATVGFEFGGFTGAAPSDDDGLSVFGFENHSDLDRTLAATSFTIDFFTGNIVESDVFFNTAFEWSTSGAANGFDLQSVATHEIGHFIGLGHSLLGETEMQPGGSRRVLASASVMFPIALGRGVTVDRALQPDDIAGVSIDYPAGDFSQDTGSIQGRVRLGGRGVFGAHVVAFNLRTGDLVGAFALNAEGEFLIGGLSPGVYAVRVEPLDDASTDSFFDDPGIDVNFRVALHDRLVTVPAGGTAGSFDITVQSK
jgi:hypothetical protein